MIQIVDFVRMTIRARVAFLFLVAESLLDEIKQDADGYSIAMRAVGAAASWLKERSKVSGDDFSNIHLDVADTGLAVLVDPVKPKLTDTVYIVFDAVVCYAAWHTYKLEGANLPSGIDAVTEEFVLWILEEAKKSRSFDSAYVDRAYAYMHVNFEIQEGNEIGEPIDLENLVQSLS
jgi:hypothetical protein